MQPGHADEPTVPRCGATSPSSWSDPRVVEIPRPLWWIILHGDPARAAGQVGGQVREHLDTRTGRRSACGRASALLCAGYLANAATAWRLYAMRYGNPSIASVLSQLKAEGVARACSCSPLYPSTPARPRRASRTRSGMGPAHLALPELRVVNRYHDHPGYIDALARSVTDH